MQAQALFSNRLRVYVDTHHTALRGAAVCDLTELVISLVRFKSPFVLVLANQKKENKERIA